MMHYTILVDIYPTHNKKNLYFGVFYDYKSSLRDNYYHRMQQNESKKLRAFKNGTFSSRLIILI